MIWLLAQHDASAGMKSWMLRQMQVAMLMSNAGVGGC
jgi:hypothetical protein